MQVILNLALATVPPNTHSITNKKMLHYKIITKYHKIPYCSRYNPI